MKNIHNWSLIETTKVSGTAKIKCPICTPTRKNKTDKSLMVWFNNGTAKCFNDSCNALFFRESIEKSVKENNYTLPVQNWKNYTSLSDALVKHCENERKINQFTLRHFEISEEKFYQPALQKEVNNVVFNYFEGETLVNKKYRSGNKKFTQSKNGKPIFYNINSIIGEKSCYIVEGEFDVLALYEIGIKNVISIPNGANDNDNYWVNSEKYLSEIEKFYIATDNDESGNNVAEKIAQRLGRYRCVRILFENKDANGDLIAGILNESIYKVQKYPISGTFTSLDLQDKMISLYENGLPSCLEVKNKSFGDFNNIFKLMLGHLCVGTGIPSHGKSNFTEWLVLNYLLENDLKASFFSPEHQPMELHMSSFCQKIIGKNYFYGTNENPKCSLDEIKEFIDWSNEKLYLTSPDAGEFANWDWLMNKFKEQLFNFGINIFVIDAYNKVEHTGNRTERENISKVLSRLASFAQQNNVLIILIAHPTKMKKENGVYEQPTLYDVSGSADFRNQTHDGFCVYRTFGADAYSRFTNLKTKYNFQGEIGKSVDYDYHIPSGRYYSIGTNPQINNLLKKEIEFKEEQKQIFGTLTDAFGEMYSDNDDVPF
jgi:twinkle protein